MKRRHPGSRGTESFSHEEKYSETELIAKGPETWKPALRNEAYLGGNRGKERRISNQRDVSKRFPKDTLSLRRGSASPAARESEP